MLKKLIASGVEKLAAVVENIPSWGGISESVFLECSIGSAPFLMKIYKYMKTNYEIYHESESLNPAEVEIKVLGILKKAAIDTALTPCILELLDHVEAKPSEFKLNDCGSNLPTHTPYERLERIFCDYNSCVVHGIAYDKLSFSILERCAMPISQFIYRSGTPADIIMLQSFIFQLLHALYCITEIYPKFVHGDLHTNNIMLKFDADFKYDPNSPQVLQLNTKKKSYYVPYFGILVKIIDFGYSSIPEENIENSITKDIRYRVYRTDSDMLWFLHWLDHNVHSEYISPAISKFVDHLIFELDPGQLHVNYNAKYIDANEALLKTPKDMMKSKIFTDYKQRGAATIHSVWGFNL